MVGEIQLQVRIPRPRAFASSSIPQPNTLFPFPGPLSLTFLGVSCVGLGIVLRSARLISCPCENSLLHTVHTMGFCLSLSLKPFLLQIHIGLFSAPIVGWGVAFVSEVQSGVSHKHSCPMFHLLRGGASFVPRNPTQPRLSKEAQKTGIQEERTSFLSSDTQSLLAGYYSPLASLAAWRRANTPGTGGVRKLISLSSASLLYLWERFGV